MHRTPGVLEPAAAGEAAVDAVWSELCHAARELGFSQIGVSDIDLASAEPGLMAWLQQGLHGSMHYMQRHGLKRARPAELVPGTVRVITARMDYLPRTSGEGWQAIEFERLARPADATLSIYARGRDYHKVLRARLQALADRLAALVGPFGHRVFTDSAPVLEVELAARSGLGWRGKHTLALSREAGSMFFLGEVFVDLALPITAPSQPHCGTCRACIDVCPTQAIVGEGRLDARRCISYLTIEHDGPIPVELRAPIGNRIYGCDDCQLVCPWNKYAQRASVADFDVREAFDAPTLLGLWAWDEAEFMKRTEGSAIRRIGFVRWRRNLAVALGNAWRESGEADFAEALQGAREAADALVREHIDWALAQRALPARDAWCGPGEHSATLEFMAPTILREGQFRLFLFSREETRIHVHVAHPDGEAKFWLNPQVTLATAAGLSERQLRDAKGVVEAHIEEIRDAWNHHFDT